MATAVSTIIQATVAYSNRNARRINAGRPASIAGSPAQQESRQHAEGRSAAERDRKVGAVSTPYLDGCEKAHHMNPVAATGSRVMTGTFSIGALALATGTKIETIRYYERIGLLPQPARTGGNYRAYAQPHFDRLSFIRRGRDLGFSLDEVRELLRLSDDRSGRAARLIRLRAVTWPRWNASLRT
jgi:hypothetical protein